MTVRINKQKINLREKLTEFEDKVNFDEVVRGLGIYPSDGNVGIGTTNPEEGLHVFSAGNGELLVERENGAKINLQAQSAFAAIGTNSNHDLGLKVNSAVYLRIKTNGNVGIGTTSPDTKLHIEGNDFNSSTLTLNRTSTTPGTNNDPGIQFKTDAGENNDYGLGGIYFKTNEDGNCYARIRAKTDDVTGTSGRLELAASTGAITNASDPSMVIKSNGNVGIGTTSPGPRLHVKSDSTKQACRLYRPISGGGATVFDIASDSSSVNSVQFVVYDDGLTQNTSGTISQISSDERLKENISDATPKLQDLLKLKVKNFNFRNDENKTKYIGFVAQEMEEVFPSLVVTKDTREYDEDGNLLSGLEDSKSTKVSMDFAILTKVIQEQQQIIEDLKSRIETLESK